MRVFINFNRLVGMFIVSGNSSEGTKTDVFHVYRCESTRGKISTIKINAYVVTADSFY